MTRTRAAIYVRISQDRSGAALGVARQEKECREQAEALGWTVTHVYSDNDKSASNRHKPRPDFNVMMDRLRSGEHDAVICWHTDRLTRQPRELEDFIILAEDHGIALATVQGGQADLSTDDGQMTARINGTIAARESKVKSSRAKSKHRQMFEAGQRRGGPRPFGWGVDTGVRRQRNGVDRVIWDYTKTVEPEAALIAKGTKAILGGDSLTSVTRMFNESGLRPTIGLRRRPEESDADYAAREKSTPAWSIQSVKAVLTRSSNAGLAEHRGEVTKGQWPAIVSEEDLYALREALSSDSITYSASKGEKSWTVTIPRNTNRRERRHLLTGIINCHCGSPMAFDTVKQAGRVTEVYKCTARTPNCWTSIEYNTANRVVLDHVAGELLKPKSDASVMDGADEKALETLQQQAEALDAEEAMWLSAKVSAAARLSELERVQEARERVQEEQRRVIGRLRLADVMAEQVEPILIKRDGKLYGSIEKTVEARQAARREAMVQRLTDDAETPLSRRRSVVSALCKPVVIKAGDVTETGLNRAQKTERRIVFA